MLKEALRSVWAEINLNNLDYNIKQIKEKIGCNTEIIGVVKADAYGHGSIEVSRILLKNCVNTLAVATLNEAIILRNEGITSTIITLGITPDMYVNTLLSYDITPVVSSYDNALFISKAANKLNKTCSIIIAVDSGMGRIGFLPTEDSIEQIKNINNLSNIKIKGILSHFSTADEMNKNYANHQLSVYNTFWENLKNSGIEINFRTMGNSAAVMELPLSHFDAVRPGIILYGCYPSNMVDKNQLSIKPVMSVKSNIIHLKTLPMNSSISYGRNFTTSKESLIGTINIGYADGYPRALNGNGRVIVNGVYAPVVGNICMDQCMVDVTHVPNVKLGDEVIIMGSHNDLSISADEIAEKTNTINYEILCRFGQRLPKIYI
ncbi:alanine racemase [Anaerovorax odorimutans]|uniref:alanine racemase n=1 Tax=Anaerovorax odorimutans TaxID=109327 RepID=UPI00040AB9E1|nr:alanine racemase [Anaerovorax odorimutans]